MYKKQIDLLTKVNNMIDFNNHITKS